MGFHSYAYREADLYPDARPHTDSNSDSISNCYAYPNADSISNSDSGTHGHADYVYDS